MSFSVYVKGVKSPTDDYKKKLHAYHALEKAGLSIPSELEDYFDGEEPIAEGMIVDIDEACIGDVMYGDGVLSIDLSKLPPGITHIRVVGSS